MGAAGLWFTRCARRGDGDEVLQRVAERGARRFNILRDVVKESIGLSKMTGDEKRATYNQRPATNWAVLKAVYPQEYAKQTDDWRKLLMQGIQRNQRASLLGAIDRPNNLAARRADLAAPLTE